MSSHKNAKHHPYCLNCHYPLSEFDKNCSQCGQKPTDGKTTLHDLLHEFIHTLFHLDGKFFWTLKHLFVPGKLTLEFFKGHHKRYAHPVQLFLVLSALAFGVVVSKMQIAEEQIQKSGDKTKESVKRHQFMTELKEISLDLKEKTQEKGAKETVDSIFLKMKNKKDRVPNVTVNESKDKQNNSRGLISINLTGDSKDNIDLVKIQPDTSSETPKSGDGAVNKANDSLQDLKKKIGNELATLEKLAAERNKDIYYLKEDSSRLNKFMVSRNQKNPLVPIREFYELSEDSLFKKYNITGLWEKIKTKQSIKATKDGGNLFHYLMSKLVWATLVLIPILALVFQLIYRRRKRFYVEHVVFLLHYNTTLLVGLMLTLFIFPYWESIVPIFLSWSIIHFFLAIKNYYKQGWIKSFFKFLILIFSFYLLALLTIIISISISFLLF